MSLAIALDQITRPTWWESTEPTKRGGKFKSEVAERRQKMLEFVAGAGKKVSTNEIMAHVDATRQQVLFGMEKLLEDGLVTQTKPRRDFALWGVVK